MGTEANPKHWPPEQLFSETTPPSPQASSSFSTAHRPRDSPSLLLLRLLQEPQKLPPLLLAYQYLLTQPTPQRQTPPKNFWYENLSLGFSFLKIPFGSFLNPSILFHSDHFLSHGSYFCCRPSVVCNPGMAQGTATCQVIDLELIVNQHNWFSKGTKAETQTKH